ncbi:MAG: hypothetical protein RMK18_02050 [Armatimonadota bacterium]|nr:hypothetical protein [Armatimonadota bacterium]MCX7777224.1 hypothetical protein [Armatimonadota bacterium]MDW8024639.1 hypothetical protein [Armatimonadota bacterium]
MGKPVKGRKGVSIEMPQTIVRGWHLFFSLVIAFAVLIAGCARTRGAFWVERDLLGTWRLTDRGDVGVPPLGERCEFRSDGTVHIIERGQVRIGAFRVERNELELVVPGAPVEVWVIRNQPSGELMLFSRSLNTTVRYARVGRGEFITGTVSIILKSIVVIALIFLLYRFLTRVLELE